MSALHIGGSFSSVEIVDCIYNRLKKNKDKFVLSKGHAGILQYVVLNDLGIIKTRDLHNYQNKNGFLGVHPDYGSPGKMASTGSLGHGLSIGAGIALANKKDGNQGKAFVLLGDGECNEGMVWEAILFASHQKLDNLMAIIDYNKLQGFGSTKNVLNLDPLKEKFESFGWNTLEVDGHNIESIVNASRELLKKKNKPNLIIANTIKGKGISSMENKLESHYEVLDEKKYLDIMKNYK